MRHSKDLSEDMSFGNAFKVAQAMELVATDVVNINNRMTYIKCLWWVGVLWNFKREKEFILNAGENDTKSI